MSDTESNQAYNDASEASIPAENGPREVANDPPPLGSAEERENDPGVAARTRLQRRQQNVALIKTNFKEENMKKNITLNGSDFAEICPEISCLKLVQFD